MGDDDAVVEKLHALGTRTHDKQVPVWRGDTVPAVCDERFHLLYFHRRRLIRAGNPRSRVFVCVRALLRPLLQ